MSYDSSKSIFFLSHFRPAEVKWIFELIFSNNSTWLLSAGSLSILLWWGSREGTKSCSPQRIVLTKSLLVTIYQTLRSVFEISFRKFRWKSESILYSIHAARNLENSKSLLCKVHIFWDGHKILQNLHLTFVLCSATQN